MIKKQNLNHQVGLAEVFQLDYLLARMQTRPIQNTPNNMLKFKINFMKSLQLIFFTSVIVYFFTTMYIDREKVYNVKINGIVSDIERNAKNELAVKCKNSKVYYSMGKHIDIKIGDSISKNVKSWKVKWYRGGVFIKFFEMGEGD